MVFDIFITMVALCFILSFAIDMYLLNEKKRKEKFKKLSQRKIYIGSKQDVERLRNWGDKNGY